ncbi:2-hydroxychromene-2-carboxylate isomerase [Massilia kyonggiensis]
MNIIEFWFDFGSNYSYLSMMRIRRLALEAGVRVVLKPFLLGPIFKAQGWDTSPFVLQAAKGRYVWRDMARQCAKLANFAEDRDIGDEAVIGGILAELGVDGGAIIAAAQGDACKEALRARTAAAQARGIFGAPMFFVGDEMFWGNDRLEDALALAGR